MKTKHTPGPWSVNASELEAHSSLCEIRGFNGAYSITKDVGFQNAQLIAAAPELAEALEWMLREYLSLGGKLAEESPQVAASKAALRKAGLLPA